MNNSSSTASLQSIWNQIAAGEQVTIAFEDKKEYNSMRVMLIRKFTNHKKLLAELGADFGSGQYMSCSWSATNNSGSFAIRNETAKQRKSYNVATL